MSGVLRLSTGDSLAQTDVDPGVATANMSAVRRLLTGDSLAHSAVAAHPQAWCV